MRQAFYTEPADQSGWLYHRWLLARVTQTIPTLPALLISLGHNDMDTATDTCELHSESESIDAFEGSLDPLAVFSRELEMCRDLDGLEPNCKWILLTTALLVAGRHAIHRRVEQRQAQHEQQQHAAGVGEAGSVVEESVVAELGSLFGRLIVLDPMRTSYYREVHASFISRKDLALTATAAG